MWQTETELDNVVKHTIIDNWNVNGKQNSVSSFTISTSSWLQMGPWWVDKESG